MLKYLALFVTLVAGIQAEFGYIGPCRDINVQQDFDLDRYVGDWYQQGKHSYFLDYRDKCTKFQWSVNSEGEIDISTHSINQYSGKASNKQETAFFSGNRTEATFTISFFGLPIGTPYSIIETDYDSYAVAISCTILDLTVIESFWLLTREKNPSKSTLEQACKVLDKNDILRNFEETDQDNCPKES